MSKINPVAYNFQTQELDTRLKSLATYWVQLHNLPIAFMHPTILRKLGEQLGRVLEVESEENGKCSGKFVQLRILKNIADPLGKGLCVSLADTMEESCILILYEKLPNFCYACGRLGHLLRDCEDVTVDKNSPGFGCWMRAPAAPNATRGGNLSNRNSDSNGPSRLRGVSESPSDTNPENVNTSMEDIILNADELDQHLGGVDFAAPISAVMEACSEALIIKKHNVSLESGNKLIPPDQVIMGDLVGYSEVNSIKFEKKKEQLSEKVLPVIQNKGKKQWKHLARGEETNLKSRETKFSEVGDGKRLREQVDQISEGCKKFKQVQEPSITCDAESAEAAVQLRRIL